MPDHPFDEGDEACLRFQLAAVTAERDKLREFAEWAWLELREGGPEADKLAVKAGFVEKVRASVPCGEPCVCAEYSMFPQSVMAQIQRIFQRFCVAKEGEES